VRAVTGAAGFLGRELVRSLIRQGFGAGGIRCLVRPGTSRERLPFPEAAAAGVPLELAPCRLEDPAALRQALSGVRVVYHAAAAKKGPPSALVQAAVDGSEGIFRAALQARVERVVLVSSFGVMGVAGLPRGALVDEDAPLEAAPEARDAYSFAKQRQEALAWRFAREEGLPLAVVRPGFVFGPGQEILGTRIGLPLFGLFLHLGGRNLVPLTYVENCADAVVLAGTAHAALGRALCIVDDDLPTSAALLRRYRREVAPLRAVPVPYPLLRQLSRVNAWYSARTDGHLPAMFTPYKVDSMWKRQRYSNARAKAALGWAPRVPMSEALDRTFAALGRMRSGLEPPAGPHRSAAGTREAPAEARA
jgi:nucleoside-diphosphate-sugar epimerase